MVDFLVYMPSIYGSGRPGNDDVRRKVVLARRSQRTLYRIWSAVAGILRSGNKTLDTPVLSNTIIITFEGREALRHAPEIVSLTVHAGIANML